MVKATQALGAGFVLMSLILAAGFVAAVYWSARRRDESRALWQGGVAAVLAGGWLAATGLAAAAGRLRFEAPPTMLLTLAAMFALVILLARSRVGERLASALPLWLLVGWQGFRFPLELMMHRAYEVGLMPKQMSFSGLNYDVVTGVTALAVAGLLLAGRAPLALVRAWNLLGSLLLLNILAIAMLSAPTPLRVFHNEPANVWVTQFPFVWLPTVMVATALLGHALIFRRLRMERERARTAAPPRPPTRRSLTVG